MGGGGGVDLQVGFQRNIKMQKNPYARTGGGGGYLGHKRTPAYRISDGRINDEIERTYFPWLLDHSSTICTSCTPVALI